MRKTSLFQFKRATEEENLLLSANTKTKIFPKKKLSVANIFEFPPLMQKIILALLHLERASIKKIVEELDISSDEVFKSAMELVELGYIGKQEKHGEIILFYVE